MLKRRLDGCFLNISKRQREAVTVSLKLLKRKVMVTLCELCASRYIESYVALVAPTHVRCDGREWVEPRECEFCGSVGLYFTYVLPEWKRGESK